MQPRKRNVACDHKTQAATHHKRRTQLVNQAPIEIFVRASVPDDVLTISQHQRLSQDESTKYRGTLPPSAQGSRSLTFVAGVGSTVFGSLTLTELSPRCWNISHVFVEQEAREIGIGDALVVHALDILRNEDAEWCSGQAKPGDRALKNLFERHGLVAQTILVGRSLNDPSTEADASQ